MMVASTVGDDAAACADQLSHGAPQEPVHEAPRHAGRWEEWEPISPSASARLRMASVMACSRMLVSEWPTTAGTVDRRACRSPSPKACTFQTRAQSRARTLCVGHEVLGAGELHIVCLPGKNKNVYGRPFGDGRVVVSSVPRRARLFTGLCDETENESCAFDGAQPAVFGRGGDVCSVSQLCRLMARPGIER